MIMLCSVLTSADKKKNPPKADDESWKSDAKFDQVMDKVAAQEKLFIKNLRDYTPMVETYIQNMRPDKDLGVVPISDEYFLGRMKMQEDVQDVSFLGDQKQPQTSSQHNKMFGGLQKIFKPRKGNSKTPGYMSEGFAQMVIMDISTFDRQHYDFRYMKREFLGDVRTLVIDVKPKEPQSKAMFIGRIWVEDEQYHIVRFNGTYRPHPKYGEYMHFDSWRENMAGNQWFPAYVYSEETDLVRGNDRWNFRAQTLLWGYGIPRPDKRSEFTDIVVESPGAVKDQSNSKTDITTVEAQRAWQRQAEDNVLDRMQRAALLAPEGDVDKVLNTVVQNLEVTNNLEVEPEIRCRVLLTQPLESFTVGHTIVVSRGLLDTLPDEASLAAILAHEMGHILSSHAINEKYAFSDFMIFPDQSTIKNIHVSRTPEEEKEADAKALQLLQNSPYKDKLSSAGLFLSAMYAEAPQLPHLLQGHFGNPLDATQGGVRMSTLVSSAPALQVRDVKQIAALPLGGRIKLNPWSDQLTIQKTRSVRLMAANEKMPFEVTPMFPYLVRQGQAVASGQIPPSSTSQAAPSAEAKPDDAPKSDPP
jgi:hypothetical protein